MNNRKLATEIITDLMKQLNTIDGDLEYFLEKVQNTKALFHAVQYAHDEGAISTCETSHCLAGLMNAIEVLEDNVQNSFGLSSEFLKEVQ